MPYSPVTFARLFTLDHPPMLRANLITRPAMYHIGSSVSRCDVLLSDPRVEPVHCVIFEVTPHQVCMQNLAHSGTFVNGEPVFDGRPCVLQNGAVISFGGIAEHGFPSFRVEIIEPSSFHAKFYTTTPIGKGGFGIVKRAFCRQTGQAYAVKIMDRGLPGFEPDQVRIRREIEIMRKVDHPHIIRLHSAMVQSDSIYIVMELAIESLSSMISRGPISEPVARRLILMLMAGVVYLHDNGVVHRDLKPENILLTSANPEHIKITDFGLSKITHGTVLESYCGTPLFMAPEVFAVMAYGGRYDNKVDSYSTGITLWHMLAGDELFDGYDPIRRMWTRPWPQERDWMLLPATRIRSHGVANLIRSLILKDPNQRLAVGQISDHTSGYLFWILMVDTSGYKSSLGILVYMNMELSRNLYD